MNRKEYSPLKFSQLSTLDKVMCIYVHRRKQRARVSSSLQMFYFSSQFLNFMFYERRYKSETHNSERGNGFAGKMPVK